MITSNKLYPEKVEIKEGDWVEFTDIITLTPTSFLQFLVLHVYVDGTEVKTFTFGAQAGTNTYKFKLRFMNAGKYTVKTYAQLQVVRG